MVRVARSIVASLGGSALLLSALAVGGTFAGCDRKETLIEVKTPEKKIEVERDKDTGQVDVNVKTKK